MKKPVQATPEQLKTNLCFQMTRRREKQVASHRCSMAQLRLFTEHCLLQQESHLIFDFKPEKSKGPK